jgi:hypothetical protein
MRIILLISLILPLFSCSKQESTTDVYSRWRTHWKNHNGKGIRFNISKKWRIVAGDSQWSEFSKNPMRKSKPLKTKESKTEFNASIKNEISDIEFKKTKKGWKISNIPFPVYLKSTPEQAVNSFIMALEFQRFEILSSLLTEEFRISLSKKELLALFDTGKPEIVQLLDALKKAKGNPIFIKDNSAVFPYSQTKSLKLIREEGGWCIIDPD